MLILLFSQIQHRRQKGHIYAGQYLGTAFLAGVSLIAAYVLNFIPEDWTIGLLGLIPIYLGIRFAIVGEDDDDDEEEEIIEKIHQRQSSQLFWTVALLTVASGGDNLGVYIPYFASQNGLQILVVLLIFTIGVIGLCELSQVLSNIPLISETIEKYERIIVPIVFVLLGLYIPFENGTIQFILTRFN